jgi:hypothetical protein
MKTIKTVSIWDNGTTQEANILNAYAVNVSLGNSATFYYSLLSESMQQLAQGNLTMTGEDYLSWDVDTFAWDWIAKKLNLVITGDYVAPQPIVEEPVIEETVNK